MNHKGDLESTVLSCTAATALTEITLIQELWSGYGKIFRIGLIGADVPSVVVKQVRAPARAKHPRGWNTEIGHRRKLKSYQVEAHWYAHYRDRCAARVPRGLAVAGRGEEVLLVLEDLDAAGFTLRKHSLNWEEISRCLAWLAEFHAGYLGVAPTGLWETGTYWHLATRPQELAVLKDERLKEAAPMMDAKLNNCTYQTLVHGDAKLANFCFAEDGTVSGVDFQYIGGGCGMKDVAYFVGSCLNETECERLETQILDTYFTHLQRALGTQNTALEQEWRSLYHVAWADFHRFLKGWSPGHWKLNSYSERVTATVIDNL